MIRRLLKRWRERGKPRCPHCDVVCERSVRFMGDVVPYEWLRCPSCELQGWGARL